MPTPAQLANLRPDSQAAAKEGDRKVTSLTLLPETIEYLDRLVKESKQLRKAGQSGHAKKIGRGDIIDGLVAYAMLAEADAEATNPEECRLMALGLLE